MMKKTYTFLAAILFAIPFNATNIIPKDTTKVIDIEEVVVIASPKENTKLRQLPVAASLISQKEMQEYQINSLKGVSNSYPISSFPITVHDSHPLSISVASEPESILRR